MPGQYSDVREVVSARGRVSYEIDVWHGELAKNRTIRGADPHFLRRLALAQLQDWDQQWQRKLDEQARRQEAKRTQQYKEEQKSSAVQQTAEAKQLQDALNSILQHTLDHHDAIDWEKLKDRTPFPEPRPTRPRNPQYPQAFPIPPEPSAMEPEYQPKLGILDKLLPKRREAKWAEAASAFKRDHAQWLIEKERVSTANAQQAREYEARIQSIDQQHQQAVAAWEQRRADFLAKQAEQNEAIDQQRTAYLAGEQDVVVGYCEMVLSNSQYPDCFPKQWSLDYNPETKLLVVDYQLPAPSDLPTLAEVRYVAARDEFTEKHLTDSQIAKLYDSVAYQVALRTIHELFEADLIRALELVVFNGHVRTIDKATGNEITACILSVQAKREEFQAINLANVDPKACFRQLKGIGSAKLHSITPVPPIVQMDRTDQRFVASNAVAHQLEEGYNLAAMPWDEFEHLIREVFEREFSVSGGEVKVTQASRDGGVDAVAFDPDPIRGGKIVIQAKRYTNTVGVSAVRDLYGTVMNEGATKGILVTTSDYGPDAYEFANGKPLTLLNGGNLLHLLEKHGHKARIDLAEAKRLGAQRSSTV